MSTSTTAETPRSAPTKAAGPTRTRQFSHFQTIFARKPLLSIAVVFLLGLGLGIGGLLFAQRAHSVVATVNGVPVRDRAFYHRLEVAAGPQVLQQMVNEEMQIQFAQKQGVLPTDADVEAKLAQARKQPNFAQSLAASRQTEDDLRHSLLANMAQAAVMTKGVTVTDADIHGFYTHNTDTRNPTARYYRPEATQVAVIVTPTQQGLNQALGDMAAGMSFADAAKKYSTDPSKARGGILDPLLRGRSIVSKIPKLEGLLFQMQVGQQRSGVRIGSNWWIIRCVGHSPANTQPFSAVQDEAREGAMLAKGLPINGKAMQTAFADFQKASDVTPVWPQYKPAPAR